MGDALEAVDLGPGLVAKSVTVGVSFTCAVVTGDHLKCWGKNDVGQLGYGDTISRGVSVTEMGAALPFIDIGQ